MTTKFEELQHLWDAQNEKPLFSINEKALQQWILSKKKQTHHITNVSELLLIVVNGGAGCFILGTLLSTRNTNPFMFLLTVWMFGSALYLLASRLRRINEKGRFDRSIRGDLQHTIAVATYQVRLSLLMRWNILPIGTLSLLGLWDGGKSAWAMAGILLFFVLAFYVGGWEHSIYTKRKKEFEALQHQLNDTVEIEGKS